MMQSLDTKLLGNIKPQLQKIKLLLLDMSFLWYEIAIMRKKSQLQDKNVHIILQVAQLEDVKSQ